MSTREREPGDRHGRTGGGEDPSAGTTGSTEARERAKRLAEAGDRAIRVALSQDSARFLAQNQQESGE